MINNLEQNVFNSISFIIFFQTLSLCIHFTFNYFPKMIHIHPSLLYIYTSYILYTLYTLYTIYIIFLSKVSLNPFVFRFKMLIPHLLKICYRTATSICTHPKNNTKLTLISMFLIFHISHPSLTPQNNVQCKENIFRCSSV